MPVFWYKRTCDIVLLSKDILGKYYSFIDVQQLRVASHSQKYIWVSIIVTYCSYVVIAQVHVSVAVDIRWRKIINACIAYALCSIVDMCWFHKLLVEDAIIEGSDSLLTSWRKLRCSSLNPQYWSTTYCWNRGRNRRIVWDSFWVGGADMQRWTTGKS